MSNKRQEKKTIISWHFQQIMQKMGLDMSDDSLQGTPDRVAKMFVDEIFYGLNEDKFPKMTVQENKYNYDQMLIEVNIPVKSVCEHHFQPIVGVAHVAYIPDKTLIGLSKLNRVVDYFARRPQVQEKLTNNILEKLVEVLGTKNVAVTVDAQHYCIVMRGITQDGCVTRTTALSGEFKDNIKTKKEYLDAIGRVK